MGAIETARERELGKQATLQREESTLKKLHDQIGGCKVAAPVAGRVRYDAPIGTGAVVQRRAGALPDRPRRLDAGRAAANSARFTTRRDYDF